MLFVQLPSILLLGFFVTAHCILTPILFKHLYTIRRRTYVLNKTKDRHSLHQQTMSVFSITQFLYFLFFPRIFRCVLPLL